MPIEAIDIGNGKTLELDIWPVGPGYTREEIADMIRRPWMNVQVPKSALADLYQFQASDPETTREPNG